MLERARTSFESICGCDAVYKKSKGAPTTVRHDLALSGFNLGWCPGGLSVGTPHCSLTAREFWPALACLFTIRRGGRCVGTGHIVSLSLHRPQRGGRIRRSWRLRGLVGKCPNLSMALAKTHPSQSRPHRGMQGPPIALRPFAAAYWRLILQDTHSRWIEATEEPQVGPLYTDTMGPVALEFPSP